MKIHCSKTDRNSKIIFWDFLDFLKPHKNSALLENFFLYFPRGNQRKKKPQKPRYSFGNFSVFFLINKVYFWGIETGRIESDKKLLFVIKNRYIHYFISLPNNILYWYVMILSSWKSACFLLVFLCFQHLFKLPHALVWHKMKRNWFSV